MKKWRKRRKTAEKSVFFRKKKCTPQIIFLHISSSYAKILGQKSFRTREFPRSGSKAKEREKKEKEERERPKVSDYNGQYYLS